MHCHIILQTSPNIERTLPRHPPRVQVSMEEAYVKQQSIVEAEHHQREDHKHDLLKSETEPLFLCPYS